MKHRYQSFMWIGRQFQSLERQVYTVGCRFHSPYAKGVAYMANDGEYIDEHNDEYLCRGFLSASIFGRGYHSRYQNFECTDGII